MTNTITLTDEQLADLNAGKSITIDPPRHDEKPVEKWEPKGGRYEACIAGACAVFEGRPSAAFGAAGLEREREDHAERAAKELRQYARLLAWRDEHCPDYVERLDDCTVCRLWYGRGHYKAVRAHGHLMEVRMPAWAAEKLAKDLNTGKAEL